MEETAPRRKILPASGRRYTCIRIESGCVMFPRRRFSLIVPLLLCVAGTALAQSANAKLTIQPDRITLNAGQSQRFSAHLEGAPAATVITWGVPDNERDVSSVSKDGIFSARIVGIYRVVAIATVNDTVLKTAFARLIVVTQYDDPRQ